MRSNKLAALAAISILTAGAPAIGQSADTLSLANAPAARAGESTEGSALEGGSWLPPLLAGLIVLGGILMATGVLFDDDDPVSP
ncbi:hypothetical protein [Sphingosinicella sp.]|uniref:hypothetical protein n=1 Tax=Sphingosinicella sp. TaxID=1917971 RepID=UPI0040383211